MTDQYRAAPELWAAAEKWGANTMDMANCILELRSRIELLEVTEHAHLDTSVEMPKQLAPMTDLSPAAQTVMNAYYCGAPLTGRDRVAAVLRVAALCCKRDQLQLLAIADELEGH